MTKLEVDQDYLLQILSQNAEDLKDHKGSTIRLIEECMNLLIDYYESLGEKK